MRWAAVGLLIGCAMAASGGIAIDRVEIVGDDNADGVLNPGESASVAITLFNKGGDRSGVRIAVSAAVTGVSVESDSSYCGTATSSGMVQCGGVGIEVAPGTTVPLTVEVTDEDGAVGTLTTELLVTSTAAEPVVGAVEVTSDSNGDGILSPGETGSVQVTIFNGGTSELNGLRFDATTTTPGATLTNENSHYCGNPGPLKSVSCSPIDVELSTEVTPGTLLELKLALRDEVGATWPLVTTLEIRASGAAPYVLDVDVVNDTNEDQVLNPGETAELRITLGNAGTSDADGVRFTLSSKDNTAITVPGTGTTYCGTLNADSIVTCSAEAIDATNATAPSEVVMTLFVVDEVGSSWPLETTIPILTPPSIPEITNIYATPKGGEVEVNLTLTNAGLTALMSPRVTLSKPPSGMTVQNNDPAYCASELEPGAEVDCAPIRLSGDNTGSQPIEVLITDKLGDSWTVDTQVLLPP